MRNWNNKLFMDAMPGRYAPLDNWITEITENRIDVVVCLASDAEIRKKSPDYAALREQKQIDADQIILPVAERRVILMDLPIEDLAAPAAHDVEPFWLLAAEVAHRIDEGFRVFVHCGAGIGRTGMLSVAVLMMTGKTFGESMEEISRAGSGPETEEQKSLLEAGVPGGFTEPPDTDALKFSDWMSSYAAAYQYRSCSRIRALSPLTLKHGLRAILDPSSDGWEHSSFDEKSEALASICLLRDNGRDPASAFRTASTEILDILTSYPETWIRQDHLFLSASLLLQAALDRSFEFPVTHDRVAQWMDLQIELNRKLSSSDSQVPDLGRYVFDSQSAEGRKLTIREKINRITSATNDGHPVLELISVYLKRFGSRMYLKTQALVDMFALAAVAYVMDRK